MISRIVIGRGRNRKVFDLVRDPLTRERVGEDLKTFLTRPALFHALFG